MLTLGTAAAQEPAAPEKLGPPRVLEAMPPAFLRANRYDVWQNYDVDRFGRFRPVVIYGPYGSYYRMNGHSYPWTTTHSLEFLRKTVD